MIAVDTNVLLRYLLKDNTKQALQARRLIQGDEHVLVTDTVLVALIRTLKGKKYKLQKSDLIAVIQALFEEPNIRFENNQVVWLTLNAYRDSKPVRGKNVDFADTLIISKARYLMKNLHETFNGVYTFDKAAQTLRGAKAPG